MNMPIDQSNPIVRDALVDLNKAREALGLPTLGEVPDGIDGAETDCPMYHGLKNGVAVEVTGDTIFVNTKEAAEKLLAVWGIDPDGSHGGLDGTWYPNLREATSNELWEEVAPGQWYPSEYDGETLDGYRIKAADSIARFVSEFDAGTLYVENGFDA